MGIGTGLRLAVALNRQNIDAFVTQTSAGAYALGDLTAGNDLAIYYAGRADYDVASRLRDHIGSYRHFSFAYFSSPGEAYDKECWLFHMFSPRDNRIHPAVPQGRRGCGWLGCLIGF